MTKIVRSRKAVVLGTLGGLFLGLTLNLNDYNAADMQLAYETGLRTGYEIGSQQTNDQITPDMYKPRVNPIIPVLDNPSTPLIERPAFLENKSWKKYI
ncbi:MAG: hypothetical protein U9R34_05805 [Nanoarchaeota archaeon]|nr:hypothetical protein [Nanoarchaeota archaeon]